VVNSTNFAEILKSSGGLTAELIEQLQNAVAGPQISDVRQALTEISRGVDQSAAEALLARLGIASFVLARHEDADRFLRGVKTDGLAICYHAHSLSSLERHAEAAQRYEEAGKAGYDHIDATLRRAGCLRAQGRIDEAEQMLRSVAASAASRAEYSFQMGCIWADRGDALTAVEYFERAVDMDGHHARALFWLAAENSLRGNDEESIKLYERSLSRPPYFVGALLNLGLLYEDHERYQTAAFCFQRVLDFDPNNERALLYLKDIEATHNMHVTEEQLLAGKNFGETSLTEIRELLAAHSLHIGLHLHKMHSRESFTDTNLTPEEQATMNRPISDLNLSVRSRKCMTRLAIQTLGQILQRTPDELLASRNFGVTSLNEIRAKLLEMGLKLRND
jgi:DNA-directed RNA polymerase subunit alpha